MKMLLSKKTLRLILVGVMIVAALYLFYLVRVILPPFIMAVILAYLLHPLVETVEKRNVPKVLAILITYLSVISVVLALAFYGFPLILRELNTFAETIPDYTRQVQELLRDFYQDYRRVVIPESIRQVLNETIAGFESKMLQGVRAVAQGIINLFSQVLGLIIAPVLAFYMLKDAENISNKIVSVFPPGWRGEILSLWNQIDEVLVKFIRGHLLVALIVGILTSIGLAILKLKFALLLGIIAGLADLIPYFGPFIGAVPAVALALLQSKYLALYVVLVMIVVQQLESNLISPKILGESVGLHPLAVIFALLAGGHLFGIVGMLVAVPVTAVMKILLNYVITKLVSN